MPLVFAFVLGLAFLLMLVTFRSVVIPVKAIVLNLLSVGAAYGVLVLVFQEGWGESLLGFESNGGVTNWLPLFLFVILFGLSMDYHVFILTRVREAYDRGMSTEDAVRSRDRRDAPGRSAAAAAVMVAGVQRVRDPVLHRLQGDGHRAGGRRPDRRHDHPRRAAAGDMKLLGDWNWWLPRSLQWLPRIRQEGDGLMYLVNVARVLLAPAAWAHDLERALRSLAATGRARQRVLSEQRPSRRPPRRTFPRSLNVPSHLPKARRFAAIRTLKTTCLPAVEPLAVVADVDRAVRVDHVERGTEPGDAAHERDLRRTRSLPVDPPPARRLGPEARVGRGDAGARRHHRYDQDHEPRRSHYRHPAPPRKAAETRGRYSLPVIASRARTRGPREFESGNFSTAELTCSLSSATCFSVAA